MDSVTHQMASSISFFTSQQCLLSYRNCSKTKATKVILPMAQISPVTINGGMAMPSWYDITGFDRAATDFKKMQSDVETSSKRLIKILEAEKEITDQIFVGGFSQGCAMSFYLGSQLPFIKGIIGLSGYIFPFIPSITQPSFFAHGDLDPLIPLSMAQASAQGKFKGSFNFHIMKGLGHGVDEEEMLLMGKWFEENTGGKGKGEL